MNFSHRLAICLIYLAVNTQDAVVLGDNSGIKMTISPQLAELQSDVFITCALKVGVFADNSVIWFRKQGSYTTILGRRTSFESLSTPRYSINYWANSTTIIYTLAIQEVSYEDSATFECRPSESSTRRASATLAVCENKFEAGVCECAMKEGWSSPVCFTESGPKGSDYKNAALVLGILFGVAVLIALVLGFFVSRDCLSKMKEQKKESAKSRFSGGQTNHVAIQSTMYDDREQLTPDINKVEMEASGEERSTDRQVGRRAAKQSAPRAAKQSAPRAAKQSAPKANPNPNQSPPVYNNNNANVVVMQVHRSPTGQLVLSNGTRPKQLALVQGPPHSYGQFSPTLGVAPQPNAQNMYTARQDLSGTPQISAGSTVFSGVHTPQSARSDMGPYDASRAGQQPDPAERGAYTDVPKGKNTQGRQQEWHDPARAPVEPRRLYFIEGKKDGVGANGSVPHDDRAPQSSTVI